MREAEIEQGTLYPRDPDMSWGLAATAEEAEKLTAEAARLGMLPYGLRQDRIRPNCTLLVFAVPQDQRQPARPETQAGAR